MFLQYEKSKMNLIPKSNTIVLEVEWGRMLSEWKFFAHSWIFEVHSGSFLWLAWMVGTWSKLRGAFEVKKILGGIWKVLPAAFCFKLHSKYSYGIPTAFEKFLKHSKYIWKILRPTAFQYHLKYFDRILGRTEIGYFRCC